MKHTYSQPTDKSTDDRAHSRDVEYPKLGLKVFFVGNCFLSGAIELFARAGCRAADSIETADVAVFLGGEDIDPQLYGEKPMPGTYFDPSRDESEIEAYTSCVEHDVTMFGICRGMQFLHVMAGGKLWQNVHNHGRTHSITDLETNEKLTASSMHHQMVRPFAGCFPVAIASEKGHSGVYEAADVTSYSDAHSDIEAAAYPNINAFAVQGHPEVGGFGAYSAWCLKKLQEFMARKPEPGSTYINPDIPFLKAGVDV